MNLLANIPRSNWGLAINLIRKGSKKIDGVDPHRCRDRMELDDIDTTLTPFNVRYEALVFSEPRSQIGLKQSSAMARVYQRPDHSSVCIAERGLRHTELTTCRNRICSFLIFEVVGLGSRAGLHRHGGGKMPIVFPAAMARALPLSHQIGSRLCRSAIGALALASTALSAQSVDDPFGVQKAYSSKKMAPFCTSGFLKRAFVLEMFGHLESRSSTDQESRAEEALAEELTSQTFLVVKSAKWEGNSVSGACHLDMEVTLPADYVSKLGGQNVLRGDMWFNMEARDTHWKLLSITDYQGSGDNSFRRFLAPFTQALVQGRLNAAKEARIAEAKRVESEEKAAEQQQVDQAAAARREWIRTHPAEYAAQQRAEANRRAAQVADERRRRLACERRGGTWGQTVLDANFGFAPSCHFKIAQ